MGRGEMRRDDQMAMFSRIAQQAASRSPRFPRKFAGARVDVRIECLDRRMDAVAQEKPGAPAAACADNRVGDGMADCGFDLKAVVDDMAVIDKAH